jgi:hypothetical protein
MKNLVRTAVLAGALALSLSGAAAVIATSPAYAGVGNQYCLGSSGCMNAWNGGPLIKAYTVNTGNNDFFTESINGGGYTQLGFGGSGPYNAYCIGDDGNSTGDAKAALLSCANGIPWGGNFQLLYDGTRNCYEFYDYHWQGYLSGGTVNGDQFYLNSDNPECFTQYPAY